MGDCRVNQFECVILILNVGEFLAHKLAQARNGTGEIRRRARLRYARLTFLCEDARATVDVYFHEKADALREEYKRAAR